LKDAKSDLSIMDSVIPQESTFSDLKKLHMATYGVYGE
jgi:hypothetical protein